MDDYLSEKEQWEWVKTQVRENAPAVLVAIVLAVAVVFGWRWWQAHLDERRLAAGAKYMQMVQALEAGDRTQALVSLGELERDYAGSAYADQGKLLAARVYVDDGALDKAAAELERVSGTSKDHDLALIARLRLARVQVAQGRADGALATLGAAPPAPFAALYHEVRGDAYYAKGDKAAALAEYRSAQAGGESGDNSLLGLKVAELSAGASSTTAGPTHNTAPAAGR
ncbi:MAG TPA: tetratricopeptide repeat protein [Steroidobacteraceae bacterium]|nr:tetratricopeptide repeat protein [Steroidobacteraceae bacterium]